MRASDGRRRSLAGLLIVGLAAAGLGPALPAEGQPTEEGLFRELRLAFFDGDNERVLDLARRLEELDPRGETRLAVELYRARALAELPARRGEAMDAFQAVIPDLDDPILREEAWLGLLRLAADDAAAGSSRGERVLERALGHPDPEVAALAGIRIARLEGAPALRGRAADRLAGLLDRLEDADLRDEALLALFRIDPGRVPREAGRAAGASRPSMIHLRVKESCEDGVSLSVNLPLSFFTAVLESLPEGLAEEIVSGLGKEMGRELSSEGLDPAALLRSLERLTEETPFEVKADCSHVRLWAD